MSFITLKTLKPRNPIAVSLRNRHGGAHVRAKSAERQRAERSVRREWSDWLRDSRSP